MKNKNQEKQEVKVVGLGFFWKVILWILGIFLVLAGFVIFYRGFQAGIFKKVLLSGILLILSGFIILPIFNSITTKYLKIKFSGWIKFFLFVILIISANVLFAMAISNLQKCSYNNKANCNVSCTVDTDCKIEACSCFNVNENVYVPEGLVFDCAPVECKCINNKCTNIES